MKSGTATANLTVNKAEGSGTVTVSDVVYGSIPSPAASSETNPGEVNYLYKLSSEENTSYSSEVPTEPGDYMVKAVFPVSDLYNECYAEATFAILQKTPSITPTDKTVTYDGTAIDITSLFEIAEGAGEASYTLEETDKAALEDGKLTVNSAGTYSITVVTKETTTMKSGTATAKLTVNKAEGSGTVTVSDVEYGSIPSPSATSPTNPGNPSFFYKLSSEGDDTYSSDIPTAPGKYTVKAVFPDTDLYEFSVTNEFTIKEDSSGNTLESTTWQNDWEFATNEEDHILILFSYAGTGDNIAINVPATATIDDVVYNTAISRPDDGEVRLFDEELKEKVVSFSVEDGVVINIARALFDGLPNLKTVDLSNAVPGEAMDDMRWMFTGCSKLESVDLSGFDTGNVIDMSYMFRYCTKLKTITFGNSFKTDKVMYMTSMFEGCESLESLDLRSFEADELLEMPDMFRECKSLKTVQFGENFNTAKVTDMTFMFGGCSSIEELDLSNFSMAGMPENTESDKTVAIFTNNDKLQLLKLPSVFGYVDRFEFPTTMYVKEGDTIGSEGYSYATPFFAGKTMVAILSKERVKINKTNKTVTYDGGAIDISDMFEIPEYAGAVTYEVVSETAELNGHLLTVTKADRYVISAYTEETNLYEAGIATAALIVKKAHGEGSVSISDVEFGSKPSPSATSSTNPGNPSFFYKLSSEGDDTYSSDIPTAPGKYTVKAVFPDTDLYEFSVTNEFTIKEDSSGNTLESTTWQNDWEFATNEEDHILILFSYAGTGDNIAINVPATATIDDVVYNTAISRPDDGEVRLFDEELKEKVVSFSVEDGVVINIARALFDGLPNLKTVDLSNAVPGEAMDDMRWMFTGCSKLESVDLSGFDTGNVIDMSYMFRYCTKLKTITFGNSFKTDKVMYMTSMFEGCESLESLDLRSFEADELLEMPDMFRECKSLKTVQFGENFNTAKVTDMTFMFGGCSSIEELDLSNFSMAGMPENTESDKTVAIFTNNDKLQLLKLPSVFGYVDRFEFPTTMYVKEGDTIGSEGYSYATPFFAGKTMVAILSKERVKINKTNKTVTYDGGAIDISDMFEIPEYAGAVTYEVVSETAELNGHLLTVTKADRYVISAYTEETNLYEAGIAAADLIVKKAHGEGSVSISDVEYGSKPSPSATSSTNPGDPVFHYKLSSEGDNTYTSDVPTAPGKYTVRAIFPDTDLYELTLTQEFTIKEGSSNGGSTDVNNGGNSSSGTSTDVNNGGSNTAAADNGNSGNGSSAETAKNINGLAVGEDNRWHLYKNGKILSDYNDLYCDEKLGWWKIKDGTVDFDYTGLYYSESCGWWLIGSGSVAFEYNDLWNDSAYGWWKIKDGAVDFDYTGLYYSESCGWRLIGGGSVAFEYNDLWNDSTYGWWKIKGGAVDFDYTGLYYSETYGWWLIEVGSVAFGYNGLWCDPVLGWWKVTEGKVDFDYTGLYNSETYGWWLINAGSVAFDYNGQWDDPVYGSRMINGGSVEIDYYGQWADPVYGSWMINGGTL